MGHQAKAHGQAVAIQLHGVRALVQLHALQACLALGREHIAVATVSRGKKRRRLHQLARPAQQSRAKRRHLAPTALFSYAQHLCARLAGAGRCGQQQRPATGYHDALAAHREPTFDECLQAACTGHAGQRPARKGQ